MDKKHIIWSSDISLDDWHDWLDEEYPDISDDADRYRIVCEELDAQLDDERVNLNVSLPDDIICIADLGLWDGRHSGYCACGQNLSNVLSTGCGDYRTWYVDDLGDLRCTDTHHDGTNRYLYRMWKPGVSEGRRQNFLNAIELGIYTRRDITRYTAPIGIYAADIYGWKTRGRNEP